MIKTDSQAQIRLVDYFKFVALISIGLIGACSKNDGDNRQQTTTQQAKVPFEKMRAVLADLHQVEASLNMSRGGQPDTTIAGKMQAKAYYLAVYQKHKVREAQFLSALKELRANEDQMDEVYDSVINSLTAIR